MQKVSGYAAIFNEWTWIAGSFWERVRPGAFSKALGGDKEIFLVHHHDFKTVLATTRNKTLKLFEDAKGLRIEAELPDTTAAGDLAKLIRRRDVQGMSFAFQVNGAEGEVWRERKNGVPERDLLDLTLYETTITPVPAYPQTSVSVRSSKPAAGKSAPKATDSKKLAMRKKLMQTRLAARQRA